ncbi:TRAP-type C4-dicarboxylate transport system, large permease component [Clostridium amylolyticum]|uniref:TRAP-type C4-dicarboxylate transport system, large permease component n=1 Tax=Clostridium amylolyticum TaxID=1121298 RepID=A0A1M6LSH7_9CLOT|nr:transporter [Clostridium amylolyticum]SHJ74149.1 TRAP-type C4-dicarboxylate transport system, large permease component [Clostridium amylolyticum]
MNGALNLQVVLILMVFVLCTALMITKKLPTLLALPLLGIAIAVIAGVPFMTPAEKGGQTIMAHVISGGSIRLASTIMATIFGAMFAKVIQKQGISNAIIRKAAELAGDKPLAIAIVLTAACALVFSTISGAGAVIMVATIVIPLMLSAGIKAEVAAGSFLMGLGLGGLFNVANYQFYVDAIKMDIEVVKSSSLVLAGISIVVTLAYIIINVKKTSTRSTWSMPNTNFQTKVENDVNILALIAPIVPILLVFFFKFTAEVSLIIATLYAIIVTKPSHMIQVLTSSLIEGIQDVAGVIGLMIGIGILLNGVSATATVALMQPLIKSVLPTTPIPYIIVFTLASPLALYRGPLNMYGLGSGVGNVMIAAGTLSPAAIGMALRSTGVVQGISDPTNTHNVIVSDFAKVDVNTVLKSTLPYTVLITFLSLVYTAVVLF